MGKISGFFLKNGQLKMGVAVLMVAVSLCLIFLPWIFELNRSLSYLMMCIGTVIGTIAAESDRFGNKSFTNDPLGWRAAKTSYVVNQSKDVSPTEALVSTTMGPIGAAATEVQAVKTIVEQGGRAAIATNAGIGAATNVVGDTTTKVLTGQDVTVGSTATAIGAGAIGANVVSTSKVIPAIATEGLNAAIPIIEKSLSEKKGN